MCMRKTDNHVICKYNGAIFLSQLASNCICSMSSLVGTLLVTMNSSVNKRSYLQASYAAVNAAIILNPCTPTIYQGSSVNVSIAEDLCMS